MSLGSISSSTVAAATAALDTARQDAARLLGGKRTEGATIADHVAAADAQEPIRSLSTTLGTLVDTYL